MKLLFVASKDPGHSTDGLGQFIVFLREELIKLGVTVKILLIDYDRETKENDSSDLVDFKVSISGGFPNTSPESQLLDSSYQVLAKSFNFLREYDPDIIHCNDRQTYMPFRDFQNVVFSLHLPMADLTGLSGLNDVWFQEYKIDRYALANSISIIYSQFMRNRVWNNFAPGTSNILLPLGVKNIGNESVEISKTPKVISFFGRINTTQKGVDVFLKATELLSFDKEQFGDLEFRLYGEGSNPENDYSHVKYKGFATGAELLKAYGETDIVIMPSKYEPFGLVGIEAMANGCLLLASTGLGMDEYLRPGENAIGIVPDIQDVASKLVFALKNWDKMEPIILQGVSDTKKWSWNNSARSHIAIYNAIMNQKSTSLKLSGSTGYNNLKQRTCWSESNPKPAVTADVLEGIKEVVNIEEATVWNPGILESELLNGAKFIYSSYEPNITLENIFLLNDNSKTFVCVVGYEFTLDPVLAITELNEANYENLVLAFYRGEKLHMQSAEFDNHHIINKLLSNYRNKDCKSYPDLELMHLVRKK